MSLSRIGRSLIRNHLFRQSRVGRSTCKRLLRSLLLPIQTVELEPGLRMELDLRKTNHEFVFWFYEEHESSLQWAINTLLPVGATFVDCGANLGLMGLLAIHHRGARVVFIEPHPRLADVIRRNLDLNGFTADATVCQWAAANENRVASLRVDFQSDGGHSLLPEGFAGGEAAVSVQTRRLAELFLDGTLQHVDLLKVDTEGSDYHALAGLGVWLAPANIELVYVEMGGNYQGIWELLMDRGYRPFAADAIYIDRLRALVSRKDCSQFYFPVEKPGDGNLLWCARDSDHERFLLRVCGRARR